MRGVYFILRLILATIILLLFCVLFFSSAKAQDNVPQEIGSLSDLNVNIEVLNDANIKVVEEFSDLNLYTSSFIWEIDSSDIKNIEIEENGIKIDPKSIDIQGGDMTRLVFPLSYYSNSNLKISYFSKNNLKIVGDKLLIKNIIFNQPMIYISDIQVTLVLPPDSLEAAQGQKFYAIHGIESSSKSTETDNILKYFASEASSVSSYTIEDSFVNDSIHFPFGSRIKFYFDNLNIISLIILSLPLPIITLIILLLFNFRYKNSVKIKRNLPPSKNMPDEISPALLDILYRGEITELGISATILDLIKKGVVIIVDKGDVVTFGRKNTTTPLLSYEEKILNELFKQQKIKASVKELEEIQKRELIDPIFEKVYREIYQIGRGLGYFEKDPYQTKILRHLVGIAIFILSIVLYILAIIFFPANPLMILPPFGITIASLLILNLAKIIPPRTMAGKSELERWLSFKKYLLGHHPITEERNLALKYLPQAETLGATEEWIEHFKNLPAETPPFYVSAMPYVSTAEWMVKTVNTCRGIAEEIEELKGY